MSKKPIPAQSNGDSDFVWGARNIGAFINRSERETYHLLEKGCLPAEKCGASWVSTKSRLRRMADPEASEAK